MLAIAAIAAAASGLASPAFADEDAMPPEARGLVFTPYEQYVMGCSGERPEDGPLTVPTDRCVAEFTAAASPGQGFYCEVFLPGPGARCASVRKDDDGDPLSAAAVYGDEEAVTSTTLTASQRWPENALPDNSRVAFPGTGTLCWSKAGEVGCATTRGHGFALSSDSPERTW